MEIKFDYNECHISEKSSSGVPHINTLICPNCKNQLYIDLEESTFNCSNELCAAQVYNLPFTEWAAWYWYTRHQIMKKSQNEWMWGVFTVLLIWAISVLVPYLIGE
ncbi:hypothetical protein DRO66_00570 [Candidatus Bathyarchaeota archaeon]|nr:MAG: hypothetical protein DRO66_00570 [Candidatus Bathyarchaeota archaeon]